MVGQRTVRTIDILMVEDDPGDVRLTREALKGSKLLHSLNVVEDGVAALDYLRRNAPYQDAVRPDLVLRPRGRDEAPGSPRSSDRRSRRPGGAW